MQTINADEKPHCRCGHEVGHTMVSPEPEYSALGWVMVLVGISAKPKRIKYRCRKCNSVFHETTDRKDLDNYY